MAGTVNRDSSGASATHSAQFFGLAGASATVFVSSACIMVVELVAGRLISRYVGQSLYTWTSIIGVVLAGISAGNYIGGRLADRFNPARALGLALVVAAVGCWSSLPVNDLVGGWRQLETLSWPAHVLVHVILVFLIPSAMLGTVSPMVAKLALSKGYATGRTVGVLGAWAVAGSLAATFLAGFWLLFLMGAKATAGAMGLVLAGLGGVYLLAAALTRAGAPKTRAVEYANRAPAAANGQSRARSSESLLPFATVFVAGACGMAIELVASRLMAKHFGQSLYTWTTVIGVVLAGISVGNYAGGRLADRFAVRRLLAVLFALSSAACLLVPGIEERMACWLLLSRLSWPMHILVHATASFLVPSILMGTVTPVAANMALSLSAGSGQATGRTVGSVYAWNALGSILGTLLAGFVLIATLGTVGLVCAAASALAVLGLVCRRRAILPYACAAACVLAAITAFAPWPPAQALGSLFSLRSVADPCLVLEKESAYSYIAVRSEYGQPRARSFILDNLIHSKADLDSPFALLYEYEWIYAAVIDPFYPPGKPMNALVVGGGGYTFPRHLELTRPGSHIEVAEIDPEVTETAHAAFGLPRDTTILAHNLDARNHVADLIRRARSRSDEPAGAPPPFDCIFGDSVNDYTVPYHLTTEEFNRELYKLLSPDGMYLLNLIDIHDPGNFLGAIINTCRRVFPHVYVISTHDAPSERDTFVVVASKRPVDLGDVAARAHRYGAFLGRVLTKDELDELRNRVNGMVLTDDYAPAENLLAPVVRRGKATIEVTYLDTALDLLARGDLDSAEAECRRALGVREAYPDALVTLGVVLSQKGDAEAAIEAWKKALDVDSTTGLAHYNLGLAYRDKGDVPAALAALRRCIEVAPTSEQARQQLVVLLLESGAFQEAIEPARWLAEWNPLSRDAQYNLGLALSGTGDVEGAIAAWRKAAALQPKDADSYLNIATALWQQKDYDGAWAAVKQCRQSGGAIPPDLLDGLTKDSVRSE